MEMTAPREPQDAILGPLDQYCTSNVQFLQGHLPVTDPDATLLTVLHKVMPMHELTITWR